MTSFTHAVRWIECTGNGDLDCEELFESLDAAQQWLAEAETEDEHGYLPVIFDHCGPRTIVALAR
jgi:hypothetical protein